MWYWVVALVAVPAVVMISYLMGYLCYRRYLEFIRHVYDTDGVEGAKKIVNSLPAPTGVTGTSSASFPVRAGRQKLPTNK